MTSTLILKNNADVKWAFVAQSSGWAYGSISYRDQLLGAPLIDGLLFLRRQDNSETHWLMAENVEQTSERSARLSGRAIVDDINFQFELLASFSSRLTSFIFRFPVQC